VRSNYHGRRISKSHRIARRSNLGWSIYFLLLLHGIARLEHLATSRSGAAVPMAARISSERSLLAALSRLQPTQTCRLRRQANPTNSRHKPANPSGLITQTRAPRQAVLRLWTTTRRFKRVFFKTSTCPLWTRPARSICALMGDQVSADPCVTPRCSPPATADP
jgi:hypothetical protein